MVCGQLPGRDDAERGGTAAGIAQMPTETLRSRLLAVTNRCRDLAALQCPCPYDDDMPGGLAENEETSSNDIWAPIRRLVELSDSDFEAIIEAIREPRLNRRAIGEAVRAAVPELSKREAGSAVAAAIGYVAGWIAAGRPDSDPPVHERAAKRAYPNEAQTAERERVARFIMQPSIALAAGALVAAQSRGQEVEQVKIGLDLSPIEWNEKVGSALLPSFTLSIDTFDQITLEVAKRDTFVLDVDDVRQLRDSAIRAVETLENLQSEYGSAGILIWSASGEGDDV